VGEPQAVLDMRVLTEKRVSMGEWMFRPRERAMATSGRGEL